MLVLNRKENEQILIGDNIRIVVIKNKGRRGVTLGIEAPKDCRIIRAELDVSRDDKTSK